MLHCFEIAFGNNQEKDRQFPQTIQYGTSAFVLRFLTFRVTRRPSCTRLGSKSCLKLLTDTISNELIGNQSKKKNTKERQNVEIPRPKKWFMK
jgi:hypothetical protein